MIRLPLTSISQSHLRTPLKKPKSSESMMVSNQSFWRSSNLRRNLSLIGMQRSRKHWPVPNSSLTSGEIKLWHWLRNWTNPQATRWSSGLASITGVRLNLTTWFKTQRQSVRSTGQITAGNLLYAVILSHPQKTSSYANPSPRTLEIALFRRFMLIVEALKSRSFVPKLIQFIR